MSLPEKIPKAIRGAPIELQQRAFEKGLIPFIPALQPEKTR